MQLRRALRQIDRRRDQPGVALGRRAGFGDEHGLFHDLVVAEHEAAAVAGGPVLDRQAGRQGSAAALSGDMGDDTVTYTLLTESDLDLAPQLKQLLSDARTAVLRVMG